jgi:hypothetical protein
MTGMRQGLSAAVPLASRSHLPAPKAEVSTLLGSGTFYFALTEVIFKT